MEPSLPYKRNIKSKRGTSLLEVLCALSLVTLGVFSTLQVFGISAKQTRALAQEQRALRILENEIEGLRAMPFAELRQGEATPLGAEASELAPLPGAKGSVDVAPVENLPNLKRVTARLSWSAAEGRRITRSLCTQIAAREGTP
jgi:Tfp pilus assembly protein PilV